MADSRAVKSDAFAYDAQGVCAKKTNYYHYLPRYLIHVDNCSVDCPR